MLKHSVIPECRPLSAQNKRSGIKQYVSGNTKYSLRFRKKNKCTKKRYFHSETIWTTIFSLHIFEVDPRIMFLKYHVVLLKNSWHEANFVVCIQNCLESPIYIISLAHLLIYIWSLQTSFLAFPTPFGALFTQWEEWREVKKRWEERRVE